jgi:TolA-binding protein
MNHFLMNEDVLLVGQRKNPEIRKKSNLNLSDSEDHAEQTDLKVRKRFGTQPWMNTKYITNNFENRHQAQQKVLQEQQKQLKEQQRIIEELQFAQNQNQFHEQLEKQQAILEHLARNIRLSDRFVPHDPLNHPC